MNTKQTSPHSQGKKLGMGGNVWALADQMLISGTNFITMVLLARGLSSRAAFGAFVLVHSILLFSNSVQSALVTQPHNVLGVSRSHGDYVRYTSSTAFSQLAIVFGLAVLVFFAWGISLLVGWSESPLLLAMVPTVLAWQVQEFMRRVLYTESRTAMAFAVDSLAYGGQTLAISVLWWQDGLSGSLALYSIALASALAALLGGWLLRGSLAWQFDVEDVRANWHFGKWLAGGYIVGNWFSSQFLIFVAAAVLGTWAAGILRAIHTVFGPLRILAQAFSTTLPIRLASTLENQGPRAFRRDVRYAFLVAAPLLGSYCLLVALLSGNVLTFVFGAKYAGHETVLMGYAVAAFVGYLCIVAAAILRATRHTRQIFVCELCATLAVVPLSSLLIPLLGIYGVVLGMLSTDLLLLTLFFRAYQATMAEIESQDVPLSQESEVEGLPGAAPSPDSAQRPEAALPSQRGQLLLRFFEALDRQKIPYCVLHGYEHYPQHIPSDVDCIVPQSALSDPSFATLLRQLGGDVAIVQWIRGGAQGIVLRIPASDGASEFLQLDISDGCHLNKRVPFYSAEEILGNRQRCRQFWVPVAKIEFACYLIRRLIKQKLSSAQAQRLSQLYQQDGPGCRQEVERFLGKDSAAQVTQAAATGDWQAVHSRLLPLRRELLRRAVRRQPLQVLLNLVRGLGRRLRRWTAPSGFHIALLGPDGAGKSSVAHEVQQALSPVFLDSRLRSFPPRLLNRPTGNPAQPHDIPPRSPAASMVRAVLYWWTYYGPGYYLTIYPALVRCALVIHDRHVIDCLVDPVRYRYSGPSWLLGWLWRWIPQPELVILIDVPAEVVQQRKQEVSFEVSAQQREAYRRLVEQLPNGRIVNGAQPLAHVVWQVNDLILNNLTQRVSS